MYKNLAIWNEAIALIKIIYSIADNLPKSEEYNLKAQLKRAIVSVALNIAEGKNRKTAKDFANFLNMASGSLSEASAILVISEELSFTEVDKDIYDKIDVLNRRINALRLTLIRKNTNEK
ncbi:MAG: four helix bundle protein [Candidatus Gastranaerophilales bacterium]|nr:four helix bundle protein [Candidatus Gastranaerophilales bacterium]